MTFERLFTAALKRPLPPLLRVSDDAPTIGLGESGKFRRGKVSLGLPDWCWPRDPIPAADGTIALIHAYHFFEHLTGEDAIKMLAECQRVLVPGGIIQYAMPLAGAELSYEDLTHKSFWTESSMKTLLHNQYYSPSGTEWQLRIHYQVITGVVARNLIVLGQLVKAGTNPWLITDSQPSQTNTKDSNDE
jgi:hypothetical protein